MCDPAESTAASSVEPDRKWQRFGIPHAASGELPEFPDGDAYPTTRSEGQVLERSRSLCQQEANSWAVQQAREEAERGRSRSAEVELQNSATGPTQFRSLAEERNYLISRVIETCVQVAIASGFSPSSASSANAAEALHPILPLVPVFLPSGPSSPSRRRTMGYLQITNYHAALMRKLWDGPFSDSSQCLSEEFTPGSVRPLTPGGGSNSGARFFESKSGIFITKNLGEKPLVDGEKEFLIERGVLEAYSAHLSEEEVDEQGRSIMVQDRQGRVRPKYKETLLPEYLLIFEVKLVDPRSCEVKETTSEFCLRDLSAWKALQVVLRRTGWENRGERMLVMTSVFAEWRCDDGEDYRLNLQRPLKVWDLKGNLDRGRRNPDDSEVFRDAQLVKAREFFYLETEELSRLSRVLKRDTEWLYRECLCDYSLLVGYFEVPPEAASGESSPQDGRGGLLLHSQSFPVDTWRSISEKSGTPRNSSRSGHFRSWLPQATSKAAARWTGTNGTPGDATPLLDETEAESWRSARFKHHLRRASVTARTLLRRMSSWRSDEQPGAVSSASRIRGHSLACVYVKYQPGLMQRARFHAKTAKAVVRGIARPADRPPEVRSGKLLVGIIDILEMWSTVRCMHYTCLWRCCCFCPASDVIRPDRYRVRFEDFFYARFRDHVHFPLVQHPTSPADSSTRSYSLRDQEAYLLGSESNSLNGDSGAARSYRM
mmetsp:Transcript_30575/g.71417  ORF Transcript_30575/g.71417 Transcript_30575/m.71417 type:complete len:714 (+) Transcript_30575:105-2246(+)